MKKLILMLLIATSAVAQEEKLNLIINTDYAIFKEQKLNIGAEIEMEMKYFYAKLGAENFNLSLNYFDVHGGIGMNLHIKEGRIYTGARLGKIWRENKTTVPLFGYEAGVQYNISSRIALKVYGTYDYRTEGDFLGYDGFWRGSGKAGIVIKLGNLGGNRYIEEDCQILEN